MSGITVVYPMRHGLTSAFSLVLLAMVPLARHSVGQSADNEVSPWVVERAAESDRALNEVYQQLQQILNDAGRSALKETQRAWVDFKERDAHELSILVRMAGDRERIYKFQGEESSKQGEALKSLGRPIGDNGRYDLEVDTAVEADRMLNSTYQKTLAMLPAERVEGFKEVQRLWLVFRDLFVGLDSGFRGGRREDAVLRDLTMRRVVNLRHYNVVLNQLQFPANSDAFWERRFEYREVSDPESFPDVFRFAR